MISKEIFAKVRKLEIRTKGLVNNLFGGEYHSAFKGKGMVFSEVREYQYGDDIRQIDWNVTARNDKPFIKVFEEEREQTLMLCVDVSKSEVFGSVNQSKKELATELSAILAFSAVLNGDKVGMILFSDKIEKVVMPRKGRQHILRLIRELYTIEPQGTGTNLGLALDYVNKVLNRRSIVITISDFMAHDFERTLKITNKKHDLVALRITDRLEDDLPDIGLINLKDAETGRIMLIDTSSAKVRQTYATRRVKQKAEQERQFTKMKVDMVPLYTNESFVEPLMTFFKRRGQRY